MNFMSRKEDKCTQVDLTLIYITVSYTYTMDNVLYPYTAENYVTMSFHIIIIIMCTSNKIILNCFCMKYIIPPPHTYNGCGWGRDYMPAGRKLV